MPLPPLVLLPQRLLGPSVCWQHRFTSDHITSRCLQEHEQLLKHTDLLAAAAACPRLAITLADGSLLGAFLQAFEGLAGLSETTAGQVGRTLCCDYGSAGMTGGVQCGR